MSVNAVEKVARFNLFIYEKNYGYVASGKLLGVFTSVF